MEQQSIFDKISGLEIDQPAREHLRVITTWARIIALVGFISAVMSLINMFIQPSFNAGFKMLTIFIGIIWTSVVVMMYVFLLRFANRTASSLSTQSQEEFNSGIDNLRTYFRVIGIILIIVFALFILAIMAGGLAAVFATA